MRVAKQKLEERKATAAPTPGGKYLPHAANKYARQGVQASAPQTFLNPIHAPALALQPGGLQAAPQQPATPIATSATGATPAPAELTVTTKPEALKEKKSAKKPPKDSTPVVDAPAAATHETTPAGQPLVEKLTTSPLFAFLEAQSRHVLEKARAQTAMLVQNEKTYDDAATLSRQATKAVVPPPEDLQARSNDAHTQVIAAQAPPQPQTTGAMQELETALEKATPQNLDEVDKFKEHGRAQKAGSQVSLVVKQETMPVVAAYQGMSTTPAAQQPAQKPPAIPSMKPARDTPAMQLGAGAFSTQLPAAHTSQQHHLDNIDAKLQEEGLTEAQMAMVDSGPLREAQQERMELTTKVNAAPQAMQEALQQEGINLQTGMATAEESARALLLQTRADKLGQAGGQQEKKKARQEAQRKEIGAKINGFYETARQNVTNKLNHLEQTSLQRFEQGQQAACEAFEQEVKTKIDAFKEKRYASWGATYYKASDWWYGIESHPEVLEFFVAAQLTFKSTLSTLTEGIIADARQVVEECKNEVAQAREQIAAYVAKLSPALRTIGRQATEAIAAKLNALDQTIDAQQQALVRQLAEKRQVAIQKVDAKVEAVRQAVEARSRGIMSWLAAGAKKFFSWALSKMNLEAQKIFDFFGNMVSTLSQVIRHPVQFIQNLFTGVKQGLYNFLANFPTHLQAGVLSWLTGALAALPIAMPQAFDLRGVMYLVMQVLGITWATFRAMLVKRLGKKKVAWLEKKMDLLQRFITEGPMALWNILQEKAAEVKAMVFDGLRQWLQVNIISAGIKKLLSFLTPATAIVAAITSIYGAVMFILDNKDRLVQLFTTIIGGLSAVANNQMDDFAASITQTLASLLPLLIGFLAGLLGLGSVVPTIQKILKAAAKPVHKAMYKAVDWVVNRFKKQSAPVTSSNQLEPQDKKNNQRYVKEIISELEGHPSKKAETFEQVYEAKKIQARQLKKNYQQKVRKGLKVTIDFKPIEKDKIDEDIDFSVKIAPNNVMKSGSINVHLKLMPGIFHLGKTAFQIASRENTGGLSGKVIVQRTIQSGDRYGIGATLALTELSEDKKIDASVLLLTPEKSAAKELYNFYKKILENIGGSTKRVGFIVILDARTTQKSLNHQSMVGKVYQFFANNARVSNFFLKGRAIERNPRLAPAIITDNTSTTVCKVSTGTELVKQAAGEVEWEEVYEQIRNGFKPEAGSDKAAKRFLESKNIRKNRKYTLMWIKSGNFEAEKAWHYTADQLIKAVVDESRGAGRRSILIGDRKNLTLNTKAYLDLREYWKDTHYPKILKNQGRLGQTAVFQWIADNTDSIAMGMRSGILEANALMGIPTFYFEEYGAASAARMEKWISTIPFFHRIILQFPPGENQLARFKEKIAENNVYINVRGWERDIRDWLSEFDKEFSTKDIRTFTKALWKEAAKKRSEEISELQKNKKYGISSAEKAILGYILKKQGSELKKLQEKLADELVNTVSTENLQHLSKQDVKTILASQNKPPVFEQGKQASRSHNS